MTSNVAGFSDERFASSACIDAHRNSAPAELSPRVPGQPLDATAKDPSPGKCPTQTHASPGQAFLATPFPSTQAFISETWKPREDLAQPWPPSPEPTLSSCRLWPSRGLGIKALTLKKARYPTPFPSFNLTAGASFMLLGNKLLPT